MSLRFWALVILTLSSLSCFGFVSTQNTGTYGLSCSLEHDDFFKARCAEDHIFPTPFGINNFIGDGVRYIAKRGLIKHFYTSDSPWLFKQPSPLVLAQLSPTLLQVPISDYLVAVKSSDNKEEKTYQLLVCLKQQGTFSCYQRLVNPLEPLPYITSRDLIFKSLANTKSFYVDIESQSVFYFAVLDNSDLLRIYHYVHGIIKLADSIDNVRNVIDSSEGFRVITLDKEVIFNKGSRTSIPFAIPQQAKSSFKYPPQEKNLIAINHDESANSLFYFYPDRVEQWIAPDYTIYKMQWYLLKKGFMITDERHYFKVVTYPFQGISWVRKSSFSDILILDKQGLHLIKEDYDYREFNDGTYKFGHHQLKAPKLLIDGAVLPTHEVSFQEIMGIDLENPIENIKQHLYGFDRDLIDLLSSTTSSTETETLRTYLLATFIEHLQYPTIQQFVDLKMLSSLKMTFEKNVSSGSFVLDNEGKIYLTSVLRKSFQSTISFYKLDQKEVISKAFAQKTLNSEIHQALKTIMQNNSEQPYLTSRYPLQAQILKLLEEAK